jgi:hypothetical protein
MWTPLRWRREWYRVALFVPLLPLLEAANWYQLKVALEWVLPGPILSSLVATALVLFLIPTVFARSLLATREMHRRMWHLRATAYGLVFFQFLVNTVVGFSTAHTHLPPVVAEFFGIAPPLMERLAGAVMDGGLALVTLSYLVFVFAVLDHMAAHVDPMSEASALLRATGDPDGRGRSHPDAVSEPDKPGPRRPPTLGTTRGDTRTWSPRQQNEAATEADPDRWGLAAD